jgi:hypothetical protein
MIAATPVRSFSRMSLGATLGALCLKRLVVVDGEKLAAMRPRYTVRKKQGAHANDAMPTTKTHYLRGNFGYMSLPATQGSVHPLAAAAAGDCASCGSDVGGGRPAEGDEGRRDRSSATGLHANAPTADTLSDAHTCPLTAKTGVRVP